MLTPLFNIRIADVLDILFVATMFYTASVWLKQTRAAFIVRGLFILVVNRMDLSRFLRHISNHCSGDFSGRVETSF